MMRRICGKLEFALCSSMPLLVAAAAAAADWPQFRGPGGTGVSPEVNLPVNWSAAENIRWKADLPGRGVSCPIVAGSRVYVTACSGYRQRRLHVLCFEVHSGKKLWERQLAATGSTVCNSKTCVAGATPVTDGDRVYALFASGDLACFDKGGDLMWFRSLAADYPQITNQVGMAASPILWRDLLFLPLENAGDSFAAAIDKHTGRNLWRLERARGINWVTPLVLETDNHTEVIFQTEKDTTAYEPQTGKKTWSYEASGPSSVVSPTSGGGMLFISGGEFVAFRKDRDRGRPVVAWKSNKLRPAYASPVFHDGFIYVLTHAGILSCSEAASGKLLWQERLKSGSYWASPLVADGKIYAVSEDGVTSVVRFGEQPKLLSASGIGETILATPAIAGGAIFLRSDQHLVCIGK
jgi:outer membrane protein assembly factor BamB